MRLDPNLVSDLVNDLWLRDSKSKENLPLSHEVQNGPSCFLNSFSERSLGAAGSNLSPGLGQLFMAKGIICAPSILSITKLGFQSLACY